MIVHWVVFDMIYVEAQCSLGVQAMKSFFLKGVTGSIECRQDDGLINVEQHHNFLQECCPCQ